MKHPNNNIKKLREERGLTQQELAELLGIGPSALAKKEKAERPVKVKEAQKLANIFDCSIDDIFARGSKNEVS